MIDDLTAADGLCSFAAAGGSQQQWQLFVLQGLTEALADSPTIDDSCIIRPLFKQLLYTGVEVSLPNIVAGLKFSWPIYKSGFHVLIASAVEEGGIWAFAQVWSDHS
jgi:hypothetical protein